MRHSGRKATSMQQIHDHLLSMGEAGMRQFNARLIPTVSPDQILGIRIPHLRTYAVKLGKETPAACDAFLNSLPHRYLEENLLHALLINAIKGFPEATQRLQAFLPHVDNWAVCDILSPRAWKKQPDAALSQIQRWLADAHPYTVRFAMGQLMELFSKERFQPIHLTWIMDAITDHYYVGMMAAWYYAEVMAFHPETVYDFLSIAGLPPFVFRKSIQKALESRKISPEWKDKLRQRRENAR